MKIAVLGASGFVGKAVCEKLLKKSEYEVFGLKRKDVDLSDINATSNILSEIKPDVIYNCAAHVGSVHYVYKYAGDVILDNTQFSINLYKSLILTKNLETLVINPISNCCYPEIPGLNIEGAWSNGDLHSSIEGYGAYKRHLIHLSRCMFHQYGVRTINCMFPGIFGPGDSIDPNKAHALNGMISRAIQLSPDEKKFTVWGTGAPIRDWIYINDAAGAMIRLMASDHQSSPNPINITAKNHIQLRDLATMILKLLEKKIPIDFDVSKQDGVMQKVLAEGVFKTDFSNFQFTKFEDAVGETIKYYQKSLGKIS